MTHPSWGKNVLLNVSNKIRRKEEKMERDIACRISKTNFFFSEKYDFYSLCHILLHVTHLINIPFIRSTFFTIINPL